MSHFYSSCPIIKTEVLDIVCRQFGSVGEMTKTISREVSWLRESESQIVFVHGGEVVTEMGTMNDYYGFLTSVDGAIEDALKYCHSYKVTQKSSLSIEIITSITDMPLMSTAKENERTKLKCEPIPKDWFIGEPDKESGCWPRLEAIEQIVKLPIWKNKDGLQKDALECLRNIGISTDDLEKRIAAMTIESEEK